MRSERLHSAIETSDTDELLRIVNELCAAQQWDGLLAVREGCREALSRGKQLWGVEEHIRYRLALEAPGPWAGPAVTEGPTHFTLGPLAEVVASSHGWEEISPWLTAGPIRDTVAAELVVRGADLTGEAESELPLRLQAWEPSYPLAEYKADRVEAPSPPAPAMVPRRVQRAASFDHPEGVLGLLALVTPWVDQSNGKAQAVVVDGDAGSAIAALGPREVLMAEIDAATAFSHMAWAAASGGAHGRRRGAAAGRYSAWWAAAAVAALGWPPDPDELGGEVNRLRWCHWSDLAPPTGWTLHLAVEDPTEELAWAISAVDAD
jgi:hypothetical protein